MKLPPRHDTVARVLYWLARIFAPDHVRDCTPLTKVERLAAYELRRYRPYSNVAGLEHMAAYGVYRAGEVLRQHNSKLNQDRYVAEHARSPFNPRLPA